jgi:hypothetical protein
VEVSYEPGKSLGIAVADLGTLVVQMGFATVHQLGVEEIPQPSPSAVAILNVTGRCSFPSRPHAGLCVMMAGRDRVGELLWACCLPAHSPRDQEPQWLCESLLVDPSVVGQTHRIELRVSGGLLAEQRQAEPNAAPDTGRRQALS